MARPSSFGRVAPTRSGHMDSGRTLRVVASIGAGVALFFVALIATNRANDSSISVLEATAAGSRAPVAAGQKAPVQQAAAGPPQAVHRIREDNADAQHKLAIETAWMKNANTVAGKPFVQPNKPKAVQSQPQPVERAGSQKNMESMRAAVAFQKQHQVPHVASPAAKQAQPPAETQAERNAEAMKAAEKFKEEVEAAHMTLPGQAEHAEHVVKKSPSVEKDDAHKQLSFAQQNMNAMKAAMALEKKRQNAEFSREHHQQTPVDVERSMAQKAEDEDEATANSVLYTDSQADAEIETLKKQIRERDATFRKSVEQQRHADIVSSVKAPPPSKEVLREAALAKNPSLSDNSYNALYDQELRVIEAQRGKEAKQKQDLVEKHLHEEVKDITTGAKKSLSEREQADEHRSEEEEKANSKHMQEEIDMITGHVASHPHPMRAKAPAPLAVKPPASNTAPKQIHLVASSSSPSLAGAKAAHSTAGASSSSSSSSASMQARQRQELQTYMASPAFKETEGLAMKMEEHSIAALPKQK